MTPVVLIATHNRVKVTAKNIESLMMQSVQPKIVLVVSDDSEWDYFERHYPEVLVCQCANYPLGYKWQYGVDFARHYGPNPLIITGSDDILGIDFVENACSLIKSGYHFVGLKRWYVYSDKVLYLYDYNPEIPLGGGRCYSAELLQEMNYNLFDCTRNHHLDDFGWKGARESRLMHYIIKDIKNEGLNIVSIKGNWPMLNPFNKFKGNRNVTLISESRDLSELKQLINYG